MGVRINAEAGQNDGAQGKRQMKWEDVKVFIQGFARAQSWEFKPKKVILGRDIPVPDDLFLQVDGVPCSVSDSLPADQIQIVLDTGATFSYTLAPVPSWKPWGNAFPGEDSG